MLPHSPAMVSVQPNLSFLNDPSLPSLDHFISLLHTCKKQQNLPLANHAHLHACSYGIDTHESVGNHLVPTFADCGSLLSAQQIFHRMTFVNEFSFQSLIEAYMEFGDFRHAMRLYQHMQESSVRLSKPLSILLLNACARLSCLEFGTFIHEKIKADGSQEDAQVSSALLNMYAKCGSLPQAVEVFDRMTARDVVAWTSLIAGFAKHGHGEEVLHYFRQMELAGVPPDPITLVSGLKACAYVGSLHLGLNFHVDVVKKGFEDDPFVGNSLVDMYSKCHSLLEAQQVFDELPVQSTVTWNALIAGYSAHHLNEKALACFHHMERVDFCPDVATYRCVLKACSTSLMVLEGRRVHADISRKGWEGNVFLGTALVDVYAKSSYLDDACKVFSTLPTPNTVSWNALIAGYAEQGFSKEALDCLNQMHRDGVPCDSVTYASCLKAGSMAKDIYLVEDIHSKIEAEIHMRDPFLAGALVDSYVKCGSLVRALEVFDLLPIRDIVSWTALMTGFIEHGNEEKAIICFDEMQMEGVVPTTVTYLCLLKAYGSLRGVDAIRRAHLEILKKGFEGDVSTGNSLVDVYINCDSLSEAQDIFDRLPRKSVASWNILIAGYVENGYCIEALELIEQMQSDDIIPDALTFYSGLNACVSLGALDKGLYIYADIAREGLEVDLFVGSILVDMYTKDGLLTEAKEVFDSLPVKDVVVWTALIAGFAEKGFGEEAWSLFQEMKRDGVAADAVFWDAAIVGFAAQGDFEKSMLCFYQMQEQGMLPDSLIYIKILEACGNAAALVFAKRVHVLVQTLSSDRVNFLVSLIEMYCNCGHSFNAKTLFDGSGIKGLVLWNALLAGYAHLGKSEHVLDLFTRGSQDLKPDEGTVVSVLNACCHGGLLDQGLKCFESMIKVSGLCFTYEHCNCILDLLVRAGHVMEAFAIVERLPFQPDVVTWTIMLGGCQKWGYIQLGKEAFKSARTCNDHAGTFVMMSNIFSNYGSCEIAE